MAANTPRKIGIIADVHANWRALMAVVNHPRMLQTDLKVCLGDLIGYGPDPNESLELLRARQFVCLLGNHDRGVLDLQYAQSHFNEEALAATEWTAKRLKSENLRFLGGLPESYFLTLAGGGFAQFAHGSLANPLEQYLHKDEIQEAEATFALMQGQLCFVGHTHQPSIISGDHRGAFLSRSIKGDQSLSLPENYKYIINPGSVGQPRDEDPRASFAVFDEAAGTVEIFRVAYNIEGTQREIRRFGLPEILAERLALGK